jgi:hypothetical protein
VNYSDRQYVRPSIRMSTAKVCTYLTSQDLTQIILGGVIQVWKWTSFPKSKNTHIVWSFFFQIPNTTSQYQSNLVQIIIEHREFTVIRIYIRPAGPYPRQKVKNYKHRVGSFKNLPIKYQTPRIFKFARGPRLPDVVQNQVCKIQYMILGGSDGTIVGEINFTCVYIRLKN